MMTAIEQIFATQTQSKLLEKRIIILSEAINSTVAKKVIEQLLFLETADASKDIWLFLNSPGGEVSSGFAIYDTIRFIQPKVKIIVTGLAASIATIILLSADKNFRFAMPNARILIHQPLVSSTIEGQASDIEIHASEILKIRDKIALLYHQETKQDLDRIQRDIERDYWMTTQEALAYGLISKIVNGWSDVKE